MPNKPKKAIQKPTTMPASAARQGSPTKAGSAPAGHLIPAKPKQTNKEKIASELGCALGDFLVYREEPGGLIVAILPNGQKHKFFAEPGNPNLLHIV